MGLRFTNNFFSHIFCPYINLLSVWTQQPKIHNREISWLGNCDINIPIYPVHTELKWRNNTNEKANTGYFGVCPWTKPNLFLDFLVEPAIPKWFTKGTSGLIFRKFFCQDVLTLRPRNTYIYVFRALFGFSRFLATSCGFRKLGVSSFSSTLNLE